MEKRKLPKQIDSATLDAFRRLVKSGEFRLYPSSTPAPGIPKAGPDCQAVVLAASVMQSSKVPGLPPSCAPSGTVYLWRGFRTKVSDSPPRKVDDCLYYASQDGSAWSLHSKSSTDHHNFILSSTDMKGLINDWDLPSAPEGKLEEYRKTGAQLSFYKPFGWSS